MNEAGVTGSDFRVGQRVRLTEAMARYHGCDCGTIQVLWGGTEDTIELRLDNGVFTCVDPPHIAFAAPERPAR